MLPVIGEIRPWTDPTVLQLNRLAMHVPMAGFDRRSLDGRWSLELFDSPDVVPAAALEGERPQAATVAVPGNWTIQDLSSPSGPVFVDTPHYTNIQMPFGGPPPRLPERNPTGVYRRCFTVPASWMERRTVLHVAGAESVHAVYVNGRIVGYGSDSCLPSEYDVGPFLVPDRNELAIVVVRYSALSYIEDQDQWWMAGLHRSVWVESRPNVHLADLPVATSFDPITAAGTVDATVVVDFSGAPAPGWSVRARLRDPAGKQVGDTIYQPVPHEHTRSYGFTGFAVTAHWDVAGAEAWSAETPRRYSVTVELVDPSGVVHHVETQHVGLRSVEVRDRQLLVNGRPVWIFGVNRHDHHPDRGKALTVGDMRADLTLMRAHNISAIRTSHYPNDDAFYDFCDELGFYLVDESNIESHAYNLSLCDDPRYRAAWVDRGARMVQRDRNHPSVILWSLGNESGYGTNHDALAGWIRHSDPSRPLHYEDAVRVEGWDDGGSAATDVVCPMYTEIDAIRAYGEAGVGRRPLIMCEYSHAMGNSNGSLADYWDVITSTPGLQGGFLWEWKDHSLRQRLPDGRVRLAYGGQFGDTPHDGNFVVDGLVSADMEPHPAMREVAWVYRPVTVALTGSGAGGGLRVENRRSFTGLGDLRARWEMLVDGVVARRGTLPVPDVGPHSSATVPLPNLPAVPDRDCDVHLTVRWETRGETWFAPAGHLVAWDQFQIHTRTARYAGGPPTASPADADEWGRKALLAATRADGLQNRSPAASDESVGDTLLAAAGTDGLQNGSPANSLVSPQLNLWRAPTDNDGFKLMPDLTHRLRVGGQALRLWQEAGLDRRSAEDLVGHQVSVERDEHGTTHRHTVDVPESLADLPRIGVCFTLPARFTELRWFGRGPHANYPDRNRSAMLGVWSGEPDESPYLVPQEFGLRTDCRWFEIIDPVVREAVRIDAIAPQALHFSATHHTAADLYEAATQSELRRREGLVVCVDAAHRGLGTASCGPDVLPQYRLKAGHYEFAYRVSAVPVGRDHSV